MWHMNIRKLLAVMTLLLLLATQGVVAQEERDPEEMFNTRLIEHRVGAEVGGISAGGLGAIYTYTPIIRPLLRLHIRGGFALSIPAIEGPGFHIPITVLGSVGTRVHRVDTGFGVSLAPNAVDEEGRDIGSKTYLHAILAYRLVLQEDRTVIRLGGTTWSTAGELADGEVRVLPAFSLETAVR
ncbi:MAG: hypothetical protein ACOCWS_04260 [Alkalispirochaetaceae bacterium]